MRYGFSTRQDGSMRLAGLTGVSDDPMDPTNEQNRERYFRVLGFDNKHIVAAQLCHGKRVVVVDRNSSFSISETDGLVTCDPEVILTVTVADCYPLFLFDKEWELIGLAHVGWRGTVANIVQEIIQVMIKEGSHVQNITALIGPGICGEHYHFSRAEIEPEIWKKFKIYSEAITEKNKRVYIDLKQMIERQLRENGVTHIQDVRECTYELPDKYFSYRRERPKILEVQVAYIAR